MKTILTEWGEMPLNDWRAGMLASARRCAKTANRFKMAGILSKFMLPLISGLSFSYGLFGLFNGFPIIGIELLSVFTITFVLTLGIPIMCEGFREVWMLKRQEIVDEVAAVMRACE